MLATDMWHIAFSLLTFSLRASPFSQYGLKLFLCELDHKASKIISGIWLNNPIRSIVALLIFLCDHKYAWDIPNNTSAAVQTSANFLCTTHKKPFGY